jgi:hypothetical protein
MQAVEYFFRGTLSLTRVFMFKRSPAEKTPVVAPEGRSHLDTPVALYPVKLVFVTLLSPFQRLFTPETGLDRR